MLTVLRYDAAPRILSQCFFATGRSCLVHLIRKWGPISVFLPTMLPEGLHRPFVAEGIPVYQYALTAELEPDVSDLEKQMDGCRRPLVVVVHYFGYWMRTARAALLAHQYDGLLLEDCAHCIPTIHNATRCGDLALYSLNKIVPMVGGGILLSCTHEVDLSENNKAQKLQPEAVAAYHRYLLANRIISNTSDKACVSEAMRQGTEAYAAYYKIISTDIEPRKVNEAYDYDFAEIAAARKLNATILAGLPKSLRFRNDLPSFAFPIKCDRKRVAADLCKAGILPTTLSSHWTSPPSEFWDKHLLLPIHEKIKLTDIARIKKIVSK